MIGRLRRRVLRRTEARLERFGWRKGRFGNEKVGYCLVGAVRRETRWLLLPLRPLVYRDLLDCAEGLKLFGYSAWFRLTSWNDRGTRTWEDVQQALRCARGDRGDQ